MKVRRAVVEAGEDPPRGLNYWCPACNEAHGIRVGKPGDWTWDGNEEAPTITPSIKVTGYRLSAEGEAMIARREKMPEGQRYPGAEYCCHSVITAGMIAFCGDCTHALAGQTVPMVDWPTLPA